ncbi:hypothetical protein Droror1_Dr00026560 [Drosera rotundifolia]
MRSTTIIISTQTMNDSRRARTSSYTTKLQLNSNRHQHHEASAHLEPTPTPQSFSSPRTNTNTTKLQLTSSRLAHFLHKGELRVLRGVGRGDERKILGGGIEGALGRREWLGPASSLGWLREVLDQLREVLGQEDGPPLLRCAADDPLLYNGPIAELHGEEWAARCFVSLQLKWAVAASLPFVGWQTGSEVGSEWLLHFMSRLIDWLWSGGPRCVAWIPVEMVGHVSLNGLLLRGLHGTMAWTSIAG